MLAKKAAKKEKEMVKLEKKHAEEEKRIEANRKKIQEDIHKIKEDRQKAITQMLEATKKIKKNPLFKQIEDKFKEDEESEFEKRKQHLRSLRNLHQPLNHDEILEHAKKFDELTKEKAELRKKVRQDQALSYDYSKYQTKFL